MGKRYVVFTTLFIIGTFLHAQNGGKKMNIPVKGKTDTSASYQWCMRQIRSAQLTDLRTSSFTQHYRLWCEQSYIEVWKNVQGQWQGKQGHFVYTPPNQGEMQYWHKDSTLDSAVVKRFVAEYQLQQLGNIKTSDSIKGWVRGWGGQTYVMEYATDSFYHFRTWWMPKQQSISEGKKLQTFIASMQNAAALDQQFQAFLYQLTPACYQISATEIKCTNQGVRKVK